NLEALAPGQSAEAEGIAEVLNEVASPDVLMLGMLLHDIGKGKGHGHVAKGIPLIQELAARIGLEPAVAAASESLAAVAGTPEHLRMLYLLTYADMRAVGPGVMTGWQARVLWDTFNLTMAQ